MGIDYKAASGVGVNYDDVEFKHLTEFSKKVLQDQYEDKYNQDHYNQVQEASENVDEVLEQYWNDLGYEKFEFLDYLGLTEISNFGFDGDIDMIGTPLYATIKTYKEDLDKAYNDFKKILNLEPEIFNGFYIY